MLHIPVLSGGLQFRATDFGSDHPLTCALHRVGIWSSTYLDLTSLTEDPSTCTLFKELTENGGLTVWGRTDWGPTDSRHRLWIWSATYLCFTRILEDPSTWALFREYREIYCVSTVLYFIGKGSGSCQTSPAIFMGTANIWITPTSPTKNIVSMLQDPLGLFMDWHFAGKGSSFLQLPNR